MNNCDVKGLLRWYNKPLARRAYRRGVPSVLRARRRLFARVDGALRALVFAAQAGADPDLARLLRVELAFPGGAMFWVDDVYHDEVSAYLHIHDALGG